MRRDSPWCPVGASTSCADSRDLRFESVRVPRSSVVGEVGGAADDIERQCRLALVLQVAETVGAVDQMYGATVEYLQDRWSFGRPLASYQALKHRIADMLLMLETAKGCAEAAAVAVGTESPDATRDVSVAKAYVGRVSIEILSECVQLHGGIGMTWEHDLHLYERRAAVNRAQYGAPEYHEERLCALLEMGWCDAIDRRRRGAVPGARTRVDRSEPRTERCAGPRPFDIEAERELQARMFDAGFTGFMFPAEYGGGGLTVEHQKAFFEEAAGYVLPSYFAVSIGMLGPTILDYGTEEQKARHLPKILRGDEIFVQLLSEPSGGSDLAGALTRMRDGDTWVINGSKIWTSGADIATHGLMLARTDGSVPKHRGLSMLIVPLATTRA